MDYSIAPAKRALAYSPDRLDAHVALVTSYSALGREEEARAEAAEVLRINPKFSLEVFEQMQPIKDRAILNQTS